MIAVPDGGSAFDYATPGQRLGAVGYVPDFALVMSSNDTLRVALLGVVGATGACKHSTLLGIVMVFQGVSSTCRHLYARNRKACTRYAFHVVFRVVVRNYFRHWVRRYLSL